MNLSLSFTHWIRPGAGRSLVPRQALTFMRLPMPALGRGQLLDAVRLQLTQYMPASSFGFVCRLQTGDMVMAWAWTIDASAGSPRRSGSWAESALDEPAEGLRLLRRSSGFETQQWSGDELRHSRWFETLPSADDWQRFVRGCGADPQDHPLPEPTVARSMQRPARGWLAGDNLPAADPWQGWRWQAAALGLGAIAAAALGAHLQTREQLRIDLERLNALSSGRKASMQARARYEQASGELEALRAMAPRLSQLELIDRVIASGIFAPMPASDSVPPPTKLAKTAAQAPVDATPGKPMPLNPPAPAARLLDWDYRNGQLKLTLELAARDVTLLEITRRLERVPGLGALRVGQDSADSTLTLSAAVTKLASPAAADAEQSASAHR